MQTKTRIYNRINVRVLIVLSALFAVAGIAVSAVNAHSIRSVYISSFTDKVLQSNALMSALVDSDAVLSYANILRNQDDAFKLRQRRFNEDRDMLYELIEAGAPSAATAPVLARMEAFHREMAAFKTPEYESMLRNLQRLQASSGAKYVYIVADTGVTDASGNRMYTYIFDASDQGELNAPDADCLGSVSFFEPEADDVQQTRTAMDHVLYYNEPPYGELYFAYAPVLTDEGELAGILGTDVDLGPMNADINRSLLQSALTLSAFLLLTMAVVYLAITHFITRPLAQLTGTAAELASGDVYASVDPTALKSRSELGHLARAIDDMGHTYQTMITSTDHLLQAANRGRLDVRNNVALYKGDVKKVIEQMNDTLDATTLYLNSMPEAILIMSRQHETLFRNNQYIELFDDLPASQFLRQALDGQDPATTASGSVIINHNERIFSVASKTITVGDASDDSILVICIDITQLTKEKENAQAAAKAKSDFLSRMSHEMRTPMNAIIGMARIAESTRDVDKLKYCLQTIGVSSEHLLSIINDVLDMSKIEAGKFDLTPEPMNLPRCLNKIMNLVQDQALTKHQQLSVYVSPDLPLDFVADELRLSQVLTNLLSNAVKFTGEGGRIMLDVRPTDDESIRFSVQDDGIGMTEDQLKKLFQSFEQADGSISRRFGGTGLGLAISKSIVEKMGGAVSVKSVYGQGSTFIFDIPMRRATDAEQLALAADMPGEAGDGPADFTGLCALVAEDVDINAEIFRALMEPTGLRIDVAGNGKIACEMYEADPVKYDLILMDVQMPEMDGLEATRHIRALGTEKARVIPIIAMTANAFKEDIDKCLKSGMNDHLAKPIDEKMVKEKISRWARR